MTTTITQPEYISLADAARLWSLSTRTVRRLIESGRLEARRVPGGRVLRVRRTDLEDLFRPVPAREG